MNQSHSGILRSPWGRCDRCGQDTPISLLSLVKTVFYGTRRLCSVNDCKDVEIDRDKAVADVLKGTGKEELKPVNPKMAGWAIGAPKTDAQVNPYDFAPLGFLDLVDSPPYRLLNPFDNTAIPVPSIKAGQPIRVQGWAADPQDGAPVAKVQVLFDNVVVGLAPLGGLREDVALRVNRRYTLAGWVFIYSGPALALGNHNASAIAFDSKGTQTTLNFSRGQGPFVIV